MNELNYELCKIDLACQHVIPILHGESIGNSLSSIIYNFRSLDIQTCNLEFSAQSMWNGAYNTFSQLSASWANAHNVVNELSSCWQETYTTVAELSSFWLRPISLIYPFPFDNTSPEGIIPILTTWVNENFPPTSNNCLNFVVGQELYIFTPQYKEINRVLTKTVSQGTRAVAVVCTCGCIKRGSYAYYEYGYVNCGDVSVSVDIPDKFIDRFTGVRFVINPTTLLWAEDSVLFN